ncbi:putative glycolipid-binding domain-containing protein [Streptomonospora wellingtoniae]|uniref:Glycolipid-binding domain-containing protein n=1 Tax=Streptomonospora wellingtoniae TaxID=3075544 RepID=A0ABU2KRB1_9ACTN|nr:putative glycolipid-binding domain-containing protein [Streptomonospora sp. DSM 45055]MDT0301812.1 putative glycolipid-binding domain-containing protein [Streptomonospora sp. DSM 45055]
MSSTTADPVAWSRVDVSAGLGVGAVLAEPGGYRLEAGETVADGGDRFSTRVTVHADLAWSSRSARVEVLSAGGASAVELAREAGGWSVDGVRVPELDGCVDVDVAATPLTNTLPIRRLGLRPGEYRDIPAVWVDVPSLRVRRLGQRYTRLSPRDGRDRYEYRDSAFGAFVLSVDRDGVVVDYEGLAVRVR